MNNYNWLEQKLHKLVLSSKFIREATFDLEKIFTSYLNENDDHVFIAGMARSGTTILLNALYKSNIFGSLTYVDMPFVLAPNLWSKISSNKRLDPKDRAHGDGIKINLKSPEAFEEVFWDTFADDKEEILEENYRIFVSNIIHKYRKKRYLSKNNQNIRRLSMISSIFSNSIILIPFRDPIQHSYSLLTQHKKFIELSKNDNFIYKYMKWIGHSEFGPNYIPIYNKNLKFKNALDVNHWIEQWYLTYGNAFKSLKKKQNVNFICYEKLCMKKDYWSQIQKLVKIEEQYDFEFKESKKDILLNLDKKLSDKSFSLYFDLNSLNLK